MYSSRITRLNPTAFIILIDQSGSMEEQITFFQERMTKADAVSIVTNMLLSEFVNRSRRNDELRDYFDIAAIGYSSDGAQSLLSADGTFIKPSQLMRTECPVRMLTKERILPNGEHIISTVRQRCWITPKAKGNTPMYTALVNTYNLAEKWCAKAENRNSYPLTIFNITDGEATDADEQSLLQISNDIKQLSTSDGNVLLLNIHISTSDMQQQVLFPNSLQTLPCGRYAAMLYQMSSQMPDPYNSYIMQFNTPPTTPPFRGMSFNTSITEIISMMNIGSISSKLIQ